MPIRKSGISGGAIPSGSTEDRPANPSIGDQFYNGTLAVLEIYTSSGWQAATGSNDFNILLQNGTTSVSFEKSYFAGSYTIASTLNDSSYDIYLYSASGDRVAYSNTPAINASADFNKVVILGGTTGDVLSFSYKTTFTALSANSETLAGPVISSVSPSFMNSVNDSITITGRNFATNVLVYFVGTDQIDRPAKSVVYSSPTQLIVTRPDDFPEGIDPYTVRVENPGIPLPVGSNSHILSNSVTAGTSPAWTTDEFLGRFDEGQESVSIFLSASDTENTDIDYQIISGNLPSGLSFDQESGEISGNISSSIIEQEFSFTVRATDTGGNFVDKLFRLQVNNLPVWQTSTILPSQYSNVNANIQLSATDTSSFPIIYSIVSGSLPAGLSMSSSGLISGFANGDSSSTFTIRASDSLGYSDREFSISTFFRLYTFTSHTFTTAGEIGRLGPSLATITNAYNGSQVNGYVGQTLSGVQRWQVPQSGTYRFVVCGASSEQAASSPYAPGRGRKISADISLNGGQYVQILVGQIGRRGEGEAGYESAGGGASAVFQDVANFTNITESQLYVIAGGGGGENNSSGDGQDATFSFTTDSSGTTSAGNGGTSNSQGGGGGGLNSNGSGGTGGPGFSLKNGFLGGDSTGSAAPLGDGGFGGGGGVRGNNWDGGGGGGGYSGGRAGNNSGTRGAGGGSYVNASNVISSLDLGVGNYYEGGFVQVTKL